MSLSRFRPSRRTVLLACLILAGGASDTLIAADGGCEPNETQQAVLDRVNEARAQARRCGNESFEAADPVIWSCQLESAARTHTNNMAKRGFFSHTGPDGSQVSDRVSATGYDWLAVGENIAAGQNTAASVVDGWLSSPGHCANIMKGRYTEMGVARAEAQGSDYSPYWTQVFAKPR
jgi:uncharacterized protein YkwD